MTSDLLASLLVRVNAVIDLRARHNLAGSSLKEIYGKVKSKGSNNPLPASAHYVVR